MLKALKILTLRLIEGANIGTIAVMFLIGFSDYISPTAHPYLALLGLTFPALLIINAFFFIFWLVFCKRMAWIPIAGYLVCIVPVRQYFPINLPKSAPEGSIKILSFNVNGFCNTDAVEDGPHLIPQYIRESGADIVCLQEAIMDDVKKDSIDKRLDNYEYNDTTRLAHSSLHNNCIGIYTHYPILSKERIMMKSKANGAVVYKLKIDGDTVIVINCHLESYHLSETDRKAYKNIIRKMGDNSVPVESRKLIDKMGDAIKVRGPQAIAVARYITKHKNESIILCGDFNDNPISYAHRIISKRLNDCYIRSGNGPGLSYNQKGFNVRIDNIMTSSDWQSYKCHVDNNFNISDHYPISCWIKKR
jgi:endonuclease/exonuclease/phosphatase family metal-dependent hydrolase